MINVYIYFMIITINKIIFWKVPLISVELFSRRSNSNKTARRNIYLVCASGVEETKMTISSQCSPPAGFSVFYFGWLVVSHTGHTCQFAKATFKISNKNLIVAFSKKRSCLLVIEIIWLVSLNLCEKSDLWKQSAINSWAEK